jgi:predicted cobalt transporter CbtA
MAVKREGMKEDRDATAVAEPAGRTNRSLVRDPSPARYLGLVATTHELAQRSRQRRRASAPAAPASTERARRPSIRGEARMAFERRNYVLLGVGLALIVVGYALMAFDNSRGADERGVMLSLDSPLSLTVAPLLLLAGYVQVAVAVLWRPRPATSPPAETPAA